jgi:hypothetical protein
VAELILAAMTDEFLHTCRQVRGEIAAMLEDGQVMAGTEQERVTRVRRLRRVLSRLDVLIDELEAEPKL